MSELFEKSMATLELPQVLALLADCAATLEGKERCLALRPLTDLDDVARAQEETSAAVKMLILRGSPGFSGVKPVSASLQRADMGGSLSTRELLDIASVLRCARGARDYGDSEEKTVISHLFQTASWRTASPTPSSVRRRSPTQPAASWPPSGGTCAPPRPGCGTSSSG